MTKGKGKEKNCKAVDDTPMATDVFADKIDMYLQLFCEEWKVGDLREAGLELWSAALMYVRDHLFKATETTVKFNNKNSVIDYSDIEQLQAIGERYIFLCYVNQKEVTIDGFSKLTGISKQTLYNWGNKDVRTTKYYSIETGEEIKNINEWIMNDRGEYREELSTTHFDFVEKIRDEDEISTYQRNVDKGGNQSVGIAKLNTYHGWRGTRGGGEQTVIIHRTHEEIEQMYGNEGKATIPTLPED